jgi:hypothetical protein
MHSFDLKQRSHVWLDHHYRIFDCESAFFVVFKTAEVDVDSHVASVDEQQLEDLDRHFLSHHNSNSGVVVVFVHDFFWTRQLRHVERPKCKYFESFHVRHIFDIDIGCQEISFLDDWRLQHNDKLEAVVWL